MTGGVRRLLGRLAATPVAVLLAVSVLSGCAAPGPSSLGVGPRFELSRDPSPTWQPVDIRMLSLPPGERVTVAATITAGTLWAARAVYAVPADGMVDLAKQAPLSAPFHGIDGMGLFWSLTPASGAHATPEPTWGASSVTMEFSASIDGRTVASTTVHRTGLAEAVPSRAVFDDGISGDFFQAGTSSGGLRPAVIVFDGTDGDMSTGMLSASTIAALGYPALALSTFGSAGQIDPSQTFQGERFASALSWLRSQPGVDPERVFTFGTSRGAQLALWAAVTYSNAVYGAIAPAGTTGLICNSPVPDPSVTFDGSWVPCDSGTHVVAPAGVLDLSTIPGPLVLGCAGRDEQLDNGCTWLAAGAAARGHRAGDTMLVAPDATHLFYVPPYTPLYLSDSSSPQATEDARIRLWRAIDETLGASSEG